MSFQRFEQNQQNVVRKLMCVGDVFISILNITYVILSVSEFGVVWFCDNGKIIETTEDDLDKTTNNYRTGKWL